MTLANNYISHYRTRKSRQRRMWTWVYAGLAICLAMAVFGTAQAGEGLTMKRKAEVCDFLEQLTWKRASQIEDFKGIGNNISLYLEDAANYSIIFSTLCQGR